MTSAAKELDGLEQDVREIIETTIQRQNERGWCPPPPPPLVDEEARRFAQLERWGIPYQEALYLVGASPGGAFYETEAVRYAREFHAAAAAGAYQNLLVLSSEHKGTGKTLAAAWLLEQSPPALRFGRRWRGEQHPRFLHALELAELAYRSDDATNATIAAVRGTSMLVIDDLGTERLDKAEIFATFVGGLINARYGAGGLTAITTNLTADAMSDRYGERTYDRLRERCQWFDISHASLRRPR